GHRHGWMTPEYGRGVLAADTALARLIETAEQTYGRGQFSLIVTADHGGQSTDHGSRDPVDMNIPWIAWGKGVKPGVLHSKIQTMDTAATVVWLLGITPPDDWAGHSVTDAFVPAADAPDGGG